MLQLLFGRDAAVTLVPSAVGRTPGNATMMINTDNPTISTLSPRSSPPAATLPGWEGQALGAIDRASPITTLDALIDAHGVPAFIKIDVEGFEEEALAGLSSRCCRPVVRVYDDPARRRLGLSRTMRALGYTDYNAALGESQALGAWRSAAAMADWLLSLPHAANSGDIYARRA